MDEAEKERRRNELLEKRKSSRVEEENNEEDIVMFELPEEVKNKKLGDLTVQEFLDIIVSYAIPGDIDKKKGDTGGFDFSTLMEMSMNMIKENPQMLKEMTKMFSGKRY